MGEEEEVPLMKSERAGSQKSSCDSALQVHLYYSPSLNSETTFTISTRHITAESVCALAAKASGETLTQCHTQTQFKGFFATKCNMMHQFADNVYKVEVCLLDDSGCLKHTNYSLNSNLLCF